MAKADKTADDNGDSIPEYSADEMNLPSIKEETKDVLAPLELDMYEDWRLKLARWSFHKGKKPSRDEGYPPSSMRQHFYRIERFVTWAWSEYGFTTSYTSEMADRYWDEVLYPNSNTTSTNRKVADSISIILRRDGISWSIPDSEDVYDEINDDEADSFTDWFDPNELERIKHASLRAYAVPRREDMGSGEQDEWAAHLSQRLKKPKHELNDEDWEAANSYKIPSLVYTSCDVGFRPCEIERSRWGWFNLDQGKMTIPKEEDSKSGKDNRHCYISDETVRLLKSWKRESENTDPYDPVWLTREGNPYSAESLRRPIMHTLMDEAGIDRTNRESGWYMIRRGVGTSIANDSGLRAVMAQLRINRVETAKRYDKDKEPSIRNWFDNR